MSGFDVATTRAWYSAPGANTNMLEQALPIGNGRISGLVSSDPAHELVYLSDQTHWDGSSNAVLGSDGQFPYTTASDNFGTLVQMAKIGIDFPAHASATNYVRQLDLARGVVSAQYSVNNVAYTRDVYASHPDDLIVLHFAGNGTYTGTISLNGTHSETTAGGTGNVYFQGALGNGLKYSAVVSATCKGTGSAQVQGNTIVSTSCSDLLVLVSAGTNYSPNSASGYRTTDDPKTKALAKLAAVASSTPAQLLQKHVADFSDQFGGFAINLGTSSAAQRALSTADRLNRRSTTDEADPELEALYIQFGRYLLVSSSRDGLPPGLQGGWVTNNNPSWSGDYHTDININMNYWIADRTSLSRNVAPLVNYVLSQVSDWTKATQTLFNDPKNGFRNTNGKIAGWTIAISTNIFGGNGWWWHPAGNAWLCLNLWEHFEYTQDVKYLATIYPILRGAAQFWEARLINYTTPNGIELVDDHDWSPEQGPANMIGITYAQELVYSLFTHLNTASGILNQDQAYAQTMAGLKAKLHLPGLTATGRLQEWMTTADSVSGSEKTHRHLSPLIGLFPGDRLIPGKSDPSIMNGTQLLLTDRGTVGYGWSNAWRSSCWARLKNASNAYGLFIQNLKPSVGGSVGSSPNLLDIYASGVFQIDSNFGTPSAAIEMLLYTRPGVIELLPALPSAWNNGGVKGIGARGGFVVDFQWTNGKVTTATVRSIGGTTATIKANGVTKQVQLASGASATFTF